jgi:hypothetical protein
MSDEEGALAHQAQRTMHWGSLHGPRIFQLFLRVPCRLPCRQLVVRERIQLVLNVTLFKRPDPNKPGMQQRVHEKIPFKNFKGGETSLHNVWLSSAIYAGAIAECGRR